jgi:hypothetical protein
MKKQYFLQLLMLVVIAGIVSCAKKEDHDHHESADSTGSSSSEEWKQMDEFHMIMAETFHPYKDSANLEPVKTHAEHLATEAEKWAGAPLPEKVNNDEVKSKLDQLKTDTRSLADKIKAGGSDEEIAAQLTSVHDLFHKIQETWYGGGSHGEHN